MFLNTSKNKPDNKQANQPGKKMQSFICRLRERYSLRFHMSLILLATALCGLLASKLLLVLHMENIVIRYPLAVICSYMAFFVFIKLWLAYVSASQSFSCPDTAGNAFPNIPISSSGGPGPDTLLFNFRGGGGASGGGGATGTFEGPTADTSFVPSSSGSGGASSGIDDTASDAVSGIFDSDDAGVILIAIGILLAAIFGASIYIIYIAPHLLSEAAFNFLLGSSLVGSYKKISHPDWIGSVFKDTYKPFFCVLLVSFGAAWFIHSHAPEIIKLSDLLTR